MNEDPRTDLLKAEYLHIQGVIVSYDAQVLTINAWSVTASLAGIGVAFSTRSNHLLLLAALSSLLFWLSEGCWKAFQHAYYSRLEQIELYFAGLAPDIIPMQTWTAWRSRYREMALRELTRLLFIPHVLLPHAFVFLAGVGLYGVAHLRWLTLFPIPIK